MSGLVPTLDLTAPDPGAVDAACRTIGFLQVVGHGIPERTVADALDALDAYFALPLEVKLDGRPPRTDVDRGYAAPGDESLSYSLGVEAPPDLFEAFNIGADDLDDADPAVRAERHRHLAPNLWPPQPPELRPALNAYFAAARAVAHRLTAAFAVALGLDADFFEQHTRHSTDMLRSIRYERPPGAPDPLAGQQRMGAHTDYGIVTVLWADPVPGLQIVGPDGAWHDVVPAPGALLVNLGDLLAQWTNDRWRSTLHRVVPPAAGVGGPAVRRAMAFFHDGDHDALVEVLPTCTSADDPPRYAPVRAGDHLLAKLLGPRDLVATEGTADARLPTA
jgi:isopenicillin N synthase-like dioxygenase